MLTFRKAVPDDAQDILNLTRRAFTLYQQELNGGKNYTVAALKETVEDVLNDINNNHVFVADFSGKMLGSIRFRCLSDKLVYVYRFGVEPTLNNGGVGSGLLEQVINYCRENGYAAIALHTNSKYFKLARYYYGKEFYVHSTDTSRGYIRALFIKELKDEPFDITPALEL